MTNQTDLNALTNAQLVAKYNELTGSSLKKFETKAAGVARVQKALAEKAAAEAAAKAQEVKAKRKSPVADDAVITLVSTENPKRVGSAAHGRFAQYRTGLTVAEAIAAGLTYEDLRYDSGKGYISINA